jgi:hypothetical protein
MTSHEMRTVHLTLAATLALGLAAWPVSPSAAGPEPAGWYAGDMHVHRSCGGAPTSLSTMYQLMSTNDLAAMALLADMGNGEVQDPLLDLPRVNGQDDPVSTPGRIAHWDAEWHWDPTYTQYAHQAIGGHIVALGVSGAQQTWQEYTYPVLQWAHSAGGIAGFAHMQYLDSGIPQTLSCCGPIEYPVEVALGSADFISEDVVDAGSSFGGMDPEAAVGAYYRLLNSGFRPGFAAGTDYPCNNARPVGGLLTYGQVAGGQMTYRSWIDAIAKGRTVVSRNGHNEFLSLLVNGTTSPGGEIDLSSPGTVAVTVDWTANQSLTGSVELVSNGVVVASQQASVSPGSPARLTATVSFPRSGWLAARRMGSSGHQVHTAAVFVIVNGAPIRANVADPSFYVEWMDNLLQKTSPGGDWNGFFPTSLAAAQARYQQAKAIYQQIASEAAAQQPPASGTIWSSAATPGVIDSGPDSSVELGVEFRSDVSGLITGVRFYKAAANTGTHVGNLWSSTGTLLASATFTGESVSGWQQVSFASPVPVAANTVYVASYHAPSGHYSDDLDAFATGGIASPPLHALADGESGPNGVFAYGNSSAFPSQGWRASNYWVDVAFKTASPVTSITVAPSAATVQAGGTQQFSATAKYSDDTTQDVTLQATWTSSSTAVATVNASGLATAAGPGTSTLAAALGSVSGTASLSVQAAPLAITTTSLPGATLGVAYSATLSASGGKAPYTWAITTGLPPGLGGTSSGIISGTPTAAGTFNPTVQVSDAASTTASKALSLTVSAASGLTLWAAATVPGLVDAGPDSAVELGVKFRSDVAGFAKGIRFYKAAANTGTHVGNLWSSTGTLLGTATFTSETASGWQVATFSTPIAIAPNAVYVASYHSNAGHYSADLSYFASKGVDSPPLHALANGVSGGNGVYAYGATTKFPDQTWKSANYWVDVLFTAGAVPTLQSIALSPANPAIAPGVTQQFMATGAYSDGSTQDVTGQATWTSSASSVATVNASGLATAGAAGTTTISAAVGSIAGSTSLTVRAPPLAITTTSLPDGSTGLAYSAILSASGGTTPYAWAIPAGLPPGLSLDPTTGAISGAPTSAGAYSFDITVTDAASRTAKVTLSITISQSPAQYTLWALTATPGTLDVGPDSAVELGVKFRSDTAGVVTGIRFYKAAANTGTHVGNLWSSSGTLLATATFAGETASGWQQVSFATPISIAANTVYVASYHTNVGHYSFNASYFRTGVDRVPLHAPADGASGPNGVYAYGAASKFPGSGFNAGNYWVDVVFRLGGGGGQTLTSIAISPSNPLLQGPGTVQLTAIGKYSDGSTSDVSGSSSWASTNPAVASVDGTGTVTAASYGSTTVSASVGSVTGSTLLTVAPPPPPPDEGPGGPILVVSSSANPFSRYYAEILRAEGLNEFTASDIANVTSATLAGYDVVVLGEFALTPTQVQMFTDWITGGGNLIAMRPDAQLAPLLGIVATGSKLREGYVLVSTGSPPGAGITGETMQFHGTADLYSATSATTVARLYATATSQTSSPAVTLRSVGIGTAAAFTYDLARSVAYTRQGNPAWSGEERDASPPIRSDDLFFGAAAFDPSSDWVDLSKVQIPQADEQQRLLANLILYVNQANKPLPRFWYLPSAFPAAVVMTGDDHAGGGTAGRFDGYIAASTPGCSVEDWGCIRSTSYVYPGSPIDDAETRSYTSLGFEVALHATTYCRDFADYADLDSYYADQLEQFASTYPSAPAPATNRTHCIVWSDYDTQPKVELAHGIRFDANYYYWPGSWVLDRPGFMTGSAMPMRFTDLAGQMIDVYQAATQMTDESEQTYPFTIDTLLDNAVGPKGYYGVFTANMHTDSASSPGSDAIVASAQARGVPVVSARQMLTWLDGRDGSSFGGLSWNGSVLGFNVTIAAGARNAVAMLPVQASGSTLSSITRSGASVAFTARTIKGVSYAFFPATSGSYLATYR